MKIKMILTFSLVFLLLLGVRVSFATEVRWPDSPGSSISLDGSSTLSSLIMYLYEWAMVVGVAIFFGILVFAGLEYLSSVGDPQKLKKARKRILSGFAGLLLLLGSWLILNTINPDLLRIREFQPPLESLDLDDFFLPYDLDPNHCEFTIFAYQYGDKEDYKLLLPFHLYRDENPFTPLRSISCKPEIDSSKTLTLKITEEDGSSLFSLVRESDGETVVEPSEDMSDVLSQRYQRVENDMAVSDTYQDLFNYYWENSLYNVLDNCEEVISDPEFNKVRCLEYQDGTLREWRRVDVASFIEAFSFFEEEGNLAMLASSRECPSSTDMGSDFGLGYERDTTGAGCTLPLYEDQRQLFTRHECRNQISRPSADQNSFRGSYDREVNCVELLRPEDPYKASEVALRIMVYCGSCDNNRDGEQGPCNTGRILVNGEPVTPPGGDRALWYENTNIKRGDMVTIEIDEAQFERRTDCSLQYGAYNQPRVVHIDGGCSPSSMVLSQNQNHSCSTVMTRNRTIIINFNRVENKK